MTDPLFSFPHIDPIAISIGPVAVRWYALAYIAGLLLGWALLRRRITAGCAPFSQVQLDFLLNLSLLGILLGGRIGYVLFYNLSYFAAHPSAIFKVWEGGMAFHGGLIGVVLAVLFFAVRNRIPVLAVGDQVAFVAPIGLFFGRLANFINGELYGRVTEHPLGIIFPNGGPLPRHPSQLYEAFLEGLVLFAILFFIDRRLSANRTATRPHGILIAVFMIGYGLARMVIEFVREPDAHLGFLFALGQAGISMGQLLSLPMVLFGLCLLIIVRNK